MIENLVSGDRRCMSSFFKQRSSSLNVSLIPASWNCSHYNISVWALSSLLRVDLQSSKLKMSKPASVQLKFLHREREAKSALIDFMSSILKHHMVLDSLVVSDVTRRDALLGSLQSLIPTDRNLTVSWINTKLKMRKKFLHSFSGSSATDLLVLSLSLSNP